MLHNETLDTIFSRESCLDFTGEPIPEEAIETIVSAGLHAPTSGGRQPWHVTVITDEKILDEISYLVHGNFLEMMARIKEENEKGGAKKTPFSGYDENPTPASVRYHAPMIIVVSGDPSSPASISPTAALLRRICTLRPSLWASTPCGGARWSGAALKIPKAQN